MTKRQIFSGVCEVLMERLQVKADQITPKALLVKDLGADTSMDILDLRHCLEKKFQLPCGALLDLLPAVIEALPENARQVTVKKICSSVARRRQEQAQSEAMSTAG